ncbi:60S ribosomal protein L29-like [Psammomys obesus]|uniref:60S ribosomal protein L29-like n=1 Tax=Psammomys obesus TaxID=48139 RepID=UPI002452A54B|nr:60S ribosomal protein L29-like [Psammomys obesus]
MAQKWCQETPVTKDTNLFKGVDPKCLRNMSFAKKHNKKGLRKMQVNNTKIMNVHVDTIKAFMKPKVIKPKMQKGPSCKLSSLVFINHPKHGKQIQSYMAKASRLSM